MSKIIKQDGIKKVFIYDDGTEKSFSDVLGNDKKKKKIIKEESKAVIEVEVEDDEKEK